MRDCLPNMYEALGSIPGKGREGQKEGGREGEDPEFLNTLIASNNLLETKPKTDCFTLF